jgi:hypothetical protein
MAENLTLGPIQVHSLEIGSVNEAFRQLVERIDDLKGLRGPETVFDALRVVDSTATLIHSLGTKT